MIVAVAVSIVTVVLLWLRVPGQFSNPQFWAEDSVVFWLDQYQSGLLRFFNPYAGTMETAPRLIAFGSSFFDISFAPKAFAVGAIGLTTWAAASAALSYSSPVLGFLIGSALVVPPYAGDEILGNAVNIQWVLAPVLTLLLLSERKERGVVFVSNCAFVGIAATTGPFSIILIPIAIARFVKFRDAMSMIVLAAAVVQFLTLAANYPQPTHGAPGSVFHLLNIMLQRGMPATAFSVAAGGALIAVVISTSEGKRQQVGLLYAGFGFLAATVFKFRNDVHVFDFENWSPRYFYPFQVCIWWCAISLLRFRSARLTAALWLLYSVLAYPYGYFQRKPLEDVNWPEAIQDAGKKPLTIPVNPNNWKIEIPASRP